MFRCPKLGIFQVHPPQIACPQKILNASHNDSCLFALSSSNAQSHVLTIYPSALQNGPLMMSSECNHGGGYPKVYKQEILWMM